MSELVPEYQPAPRYRRPSLSTLLKAGTAGARQAAQARAGDPRRCASSLRAAGSRSSSAELWEYRELLYFLVWRDIKVRYKQTALGAAWAIIQPLFTMLVFSLFFGRLAKMPSDGIPYPVFSFAALVPWTFFAQGLTLASDSLVGSANLIRKVYFPRLVIPVSAVLAGVVDFSHRLFDAAGR